MLKLIKLFKQSKRLKNLCLNQQGYLLLILIILYLVVRIYHLPQVVNFSMDQGSTLLKIYELWQTKKLTLIGPESSLKTINGLSFFHGPWIYYFLLPFMLVGNWNPLFGSYAFIILNLLALIIFFISINNHFGKKIAFISALFFVFDFNSIRFSQFLWNPNFLLFTSSLLIYFWLEVIRKPRALYFLLTGLIFGFSLGSHYQTTLILFIFFGFMLYKKLSFKYYLSVISGLCLGLSPLLLFELKHNFYNLRVIYSILTTGAQEKINWPFPFYYFLSLLPFLFLFLSLIINKIFVKKQYLAILLIIYISSSLNKVLPLAKNGFTMPKGWNYLGIKKSAKIILKENKNNYNIANILSGDTRDYSLRYLLTISNNNPPLVVEAYLWSDFLFVVSRDNPETTLSNPVWEINSFCPCEVTKKWEIQNNINLYLLEKVLVLPE